MKIRKAEQKDREQILRLVKKFYSKSAPKTIKNWENKYDNFIKLTWVTKYDRKIIGFITCDLKKDALYIGDLYVLAKYRRKGVATKLINKIENLKKILNKKHLIVNVRKKDKHALKFYKKQGFNIWKSGKSLKLRR